MTDRVRLPGVSDDDNALLAHLIEQLDAREDRNYQRACYYDGKRAARSSSGVIPPIYQNLQLVLGWSAKAVDILARRCNLDGFVWPDGDLDSLGLDELTEDNHLEAKINGAITKSLLYGVSFLVNTQGGDGEPESLMHVRDARQATGDYNVRTCRLDNLLSVTGRDENSNLKSFSLYLDGRTIVAQKDAGKWQVDQSEHPWGVPAEALIYQPYTHDMGASRITRAVMSMHNAALRTVLRMEAHADVHSMPETWMLGADETIFVNADGTPRAQWQVMLGRIKGIPDDDDAENPRAEVQRFESSGPGAHIDMLKQQAQLFAGETYIPLTSLGVSDMSNPTSPDSYIASREDLIAEAEETTANMRGAFRRWARRGLAIQNGEAGIPDDWKSIDAKFRNPVYLSKAAAADAGAKQIGAIPWLAETEVGLEILGLDPQQIERALAEKRKAGPGAAQIIADALTRQKQPTAPTIVQQPAQSQPAN